jgi:hypothetical protein
VAWEAWVATLNTVHGEDDIAAWISPGRDYGVAMVADGVSTTGGGGASFLAVSAASIVCRRFLGQGLSFTTMKRCLDVLSRIAVESSVEDASIVAEIKRRYYTECSRDGEPCTRPMTVHDVAEIGFIQPTRRGEGMPSSTLLVILFGGTNVGFMLLGDGLVTSTGVGLSKEELWVAWGALPQFYQGVRVSRYVAIGGGAKGHPVLLLADSEPGRVYVAATDGVDPAALAESLTELAPEIPKLAEAGANVAAELLKRVRTRMGRFEDDASVAVVYHVS